MPEINDPQVATQARLLSAEQTLIAWWAALPKAKVTCEHSEWFVEIDGRRRSISELALSIAEGMT